MKVHSFSCALALALVLLQCCAVLAIPMVDITWNANNTGEFAITVNKQAWLNSGPIFFRANNMTYSTNDSSLVMASSTDYNGQDDIGSFYGINYQWAIKGTKTALWSTIFKLYTTLNTQPVPTTQTIRAIGFEQVWLTGAMGTSTGNSDKLISGFPSFSMQKTTVEGVYQWAGPFIWDQTIATAWSPKSPLTWGIFGGPVTFYNQNGITSTLSPISEPMSSSLSKISDDVVAYGTMGMVESIPAMFSSSYILYFNDVGVTDTVFEWGDILLARNNKIRTDAFDEITSQYIGYNTDHGAYYYYYTEPGKNYEETLIDVNEYAKSINLPYKHMLLDSWWYYKGKQDGVYNWTAMPSIFPNGLPYLHETLQMPFIMHNRYWSPDANQAKQNGGQYEWIIDDYSLPIDPQFWPDLFANASTWGLKVYEQDWLYNEFMNVKHILTDVHLGRQWLTQMGNAAATQGISLQYCMSLPRHLLQGTELKNLKQIRASDDYLPGNKDYQQWRIFDSSLLAYSLGVLPFKDNLWTTTNQPGNNQNYTEPVPDMQSAVALLSAGPYTPSDGIGYTNMTLVNKAIRADGLLLKPDYPAISLDSTYIYRAIGAGGPDGYVSQTSSTVAGFKWPIVMAIELKKDYKFSGIELKLAQDDTYVAYKYTGASSVSLDLSLFSVGSPILLNACAQADFGVYYFAPVLKNSNNIAILGDVSKWVPMSNQRISALSMDSMQVSLKLSGVNGEAVTITWADTKSMKTYEQTCVIPAKGSTILSINVNTNSAMCM